MPRAKIAVATVWEMILPARTILGPGVSPDSMAATSPATFPPVSRTVVKPRCRVAWARWAIESESSTTRHPSGPAEVHGREHVVDVGVDEAGEHEPAVGVELDIGSGHGPVGDVDDPVVLHHDRPLAHEKPAIGVDLPVSASTRW